MFSGSFKSALLAVQLGGGLVLLSGRVGGRGSHGMNLNHGMRDTLCLLDSARFLFPCSPSYFRLFSM